MRKIPHSFTAAVLLVITLLVSCRKNYSGRGPSPEDTPFFVDSLQAVSIATRISPENIFNLKKPDAKNVIESGVTVKDDENNPAYYIFSLADTGFIIISADRNLIPMLAYSTTSKFMQPDKAPAGVRNWLQKTKGAVEIVRKGWYDNSRTASVQWKYIDRRLQHSAEGPTARAMKPPPDPDPCESITYHEVLPLLPVTWGQKCTYNDFCPPFTGAPCGNAPTGCVATAMAQVMAYWRHPATFYWAGMPAGQGNYEVARLMRDAGIAVNMQYGPTSSSAFHAAVDDALKNVFGYTYATQAGYNETQVINNVSIHHPVIIGADDLNVNVGHEWVCDGYQMQTNPCMTATWMHMNWGWHEWLEGDDYNGYYWSTNWTIHRSDGDRHYQYYKETIVDIIP